MASRIYETLKNIEIGRQTCIRNARLANLPATDNMDINALGNLFLEQNNTEFINPNDPTVEGYDGEHGGWTRPTDWWDTKTILANAEEIIEDGTTYYPAYIMLLADWDVSTEVTKTTTNKATQGDAFVFSDEPDTLYVGDQIHTWDTTEDKECSEGYKTRYIIVYITNKTTNLSIKLTQFKLIECIFGEFTSTSYAFGESGELNSNKYLVNFETLDTFLSTSVGGTFAFSFCYSLTSINIPNATSASSSVFRNCISLKNISLPSLTIVGGYAFAYCYSLTSISLPNATDLNDVNTFTNCSSLTSVNLPSLTSLSNTAFQNCYSLTSINLPNVTSMTGNNVFQNCYSLPSISLSSLTSLSNTAFNGCCLLTSISLPSVTSIGSNAFNGCCSLTQLELPSTITSINKNQFANARNLRNLVLPNDWNFELDVSPCDMPRNGLLDIIDKLKDLTDETSKTFTFGADNLAKLSSAEIAVATDKNWILN